MLKSFKAAYIAEIINGECNKSDVLVSSFSSLSDAKNDAISFYYDPKFKADLLKTKAGLVILKKSDSFLYNGPSIYVEDPYLAFAKVSALFVNNHRKFNIHHLAMIDPSAIIAKNVNIDPFVVIDENTKIGSDSDIGANSYIGRNVIIGKNVKINPNVFIGHGVKIGDNCEFFSGARIGTDGFGYAREKDKSWVKIPQVGSVHIGNNVDIGSNSTIDRGAIDNTIIDDGVKIDNQVQIGHNCQIGRNTIIAGCVGIAGSTVIGKNCMIGGAAMIKGHITIADDTVISGGSTIGKNIENPGKRFTSIFPYNIEHKDWLRLVYNFKKNGKKND
jgi:UDP-3-O-[3-hydroxymyristoyl] glucosamine N-acyltransferase